MRLFGPNEEVESLGLDNGYIDPHAPILPWQHWNPPDSVLAADRFLTNAMLTSEDMECDICKKMASGHSQAQYEECTQAARRSVAKLEAMPSYTNL
jgi:hypothetical protein